MALYLNDKTSNGNTLTNVNTVTEWTADTPFAQSTSAARFVAASTQYLTAADSTSLSITNNMTEEMWVKFDSLPSSGNSMAFIGKYKAATGQNSHLLRLQNNAGTYEIHIFISSDGTNGNESFVTWTPSTGTWYHLAVTFASGSVKFYINGSQQGTTQSNTSTSIFDGTVVESIGSWDTTGTPANLFDGKIDDVRVWSVVRTQTEINNNKSIELTGTETNLNAYWPFEAVLGGGGGFFQMM